MEYPEENALNIYTDGSMLPKPRRGGIAGLFVLINEDGEEEDHPLPPRAFSAATNNQMELEAVIQALRLATAQHPPFDPSRYRKILVHTDSLYVAQNYETAIFSWSKQDWQTKSGGLVENAGQWKELLALLRRSDRQGKPVRIKWVKGKKSPRTRRVDKAAKKAAAPRSAPQLVPLEIRRKRSERPIEKGSVKVSGQTIEINVFKTEFQRLHRVLKCWYTVESEDSPFHGCADIIYCNPELLVRRGHSYLVRVNDSQALPRIVELISEVETESASTGNETAASGDS